MAYDLKNRKIGDGYSYYEEFTHAGTTTPYGEKTILEIYDAANTFGGSDPTGLEVSVARELFEDFISQENAAIQKLITGESASLKLTVPAGSLDNLAIGSGKSTSDVSDTDWQVADLPGSQPGDGIYIGGDVGLQKFGIAHKVANSQETSMNDWLYAPNCEAEPNFGWKYAKDAIRKMELTINVFPSKQDQFLMTTGRHALMAIVFEKSAT